MKKLLLSAAMVIFAISQPVFADDIDPFDAARQGNIDVLTQFVKNGGDVEARNRRGYTPFVLATYYGQTKAAEALKHEGADPCATDSQGSPAFMGVVFKGHSDTLEWLLENTRCDVNHQNYAGQTALMLAALFDRTEIAETLIKAGAKPEIADHRGNTPESLAVGQGLQKMIKILKFHRETNKAKPSNIPHEKIKYAR